MKKKYIITILILVIWNCLSMSYIFSQSSQPLSLSFILDSLKNYKTVKNENCNDLNKINICLINTIESHGIDFIIKDDEVNTLRDSGASEKLIETINKISVEKLFAQVDIGIDFFDEKDEKSFLKAAYDLNQKALIKISGTNSKNFGKAYFNRGRIYYRQKKYEQAIEDLRKAAEFNFGGAFTFDFLARNYLLLDKPNYNEAILNFTKAINLDNTYADAFNNRGNAYLRIGKADLALKDFNEIIILKPEYANVYVSRGNYYYSQKQFDLAISDYTNAILVKPDFVQAYINRAFAYYVKKEYDLAIKDFTTAIRLKPDYAKAYYYRASVYSEKKEYDLAIKDLTVTIDLKKKEYDLAIKNSTETIDLKTDYANAYRNRGNVYKSMNKIAEAEADFKKYEELTGEKPVDN